MKSNYATKIKQSVHFRLPVEGQIEITNRCNNNCRHCWNCLTATSERQRDEMTFDEICSLIDEAKFMGCREWSITGGEPMLRGDFYDIMEYVIKNSRKYYLNTNGTLITSKIARLLKFSGVKMIALYGAERHTHDYVTRNKGSFDALMQGLNYLKEAGASFIIQLVPMKSNFYQFDKMLKLAKTLSSNWRIGASWLYMRADGNQQRNQEIKKERLKPSEVIMIDNPNVVYDEKILLDSSSDNVVESYHFDNCISNRESFAVDPYSQMSFCGYIKDADFRCDLRKKSFSDAWENEIPLFKTKIKKSRQYIQARKECEVEKDCSCCPVFFYLENGDYEKKIDYLCEITREKTKYKELFLRSHRRYFQIAGILIQINSELAFFDEMFNKKFKDFVVSVSDVQETKDLVVLEHYFTIPERAKSVDGQHVYRKAPWEILKVKNKWVYKGIIEHKGKDDFFTIVEFSDDHKRGIFYHNDSKIFIKGNVNAVSLMPSDQIFLTQVLARLEGCFFHAAGVVYDGAGYLFVGHSEAGKSTMVGLLREKVKILCDDRIIVRKIDGRFKMYGTWSHGDVSDVASDGVFIKGVYFIKQSMDNRVEVIKDKTRIASLLCEYLIKGLQTKEWWDKTFNLFDAMVEVVDFFDLYFDKSGQVSEVLFSNNVL